VRKSRYCCQLGVPSAPVQAQRNVDEPLCEGMQLVHLERRGDLPVFRFRQIRNTPDGCHNLPCRATVTHVDGLGNDQTTMGVYSVGDAA
jgi:hypothetical protein